MAGAAASWPMASYTSPVDSVWLEGKRAFNVAAGGLFRPQVSTDLIGLPASVRRDRLLDFSDFIIHLSVLSIPLRSHPSIVGSSQSIE